ncbi:MAG: hypothetical protein KAQ65_04170 [Candidatus Thorarchaeota archaeon]|nr:hypothetical protein [Candidatus Thorarchaeota archaeon]MCK5238528.1 hypothetical protein [Candidatus Thorarchaeota archaeon]
MAEIKFEGVNSSILLEYLGTYTDVSWKKTWSFEGMVVGFFEFKPRLLHGDCVVNLIVEIDSITDKSNVRIKPHGGGGSRHDRGRIETFWKKIRADLVALANEHCWKFEIVKPKYRGEICPYCTAIYSYQRDKILDDGSVNCQNCNRNFTPDDVVQDQDIAEIGEVLGDSFAGN